MANFYKHLRPLSFRQFYRNFSATTHFEKITKTIGFIGDGNMAKAICSSIEKRGLIKFSQVYVSSPYIKKMDIWKNWGANVTTDNNVVAENSDVIILAVKPHILNEAISTLKDDIKNKLFVSILAGFTIKDLQKKLARFKGSRIVRVMPNTPMLVGEGCTVYCPAKNVNEDDLKIVTAVLTATGDCQRVPENMINAICAVSGSGPAFVYLFIEALSDGGVRMGLHREMSTKIAAQTVLGAAKMVLHTGRHMGTLKDEVCSAGGTTVAGLHALERGAVRGAVMNAVEAAALRADELGKCNS